MKNGSNLKIMDTSRNTVHVLLSVGLWSTAFVTFSVSWELCNVVLLVVKVLSFRGQEIKASVHQLHNGQPLLFNS